MKLSKQERIGILVVAIVLILGLGIWMFIVPKIESVNNSNKTLASKEQELANAQSEALLKDSLKDQIMDAYEEGEDYANMFFEEMTTYQADAEFRAFLEQCEANVLVESITVGEPTTATLAPQYFEEEEVTYDLKTYVTQDIEKTDEEIASEERWTELKNALGVSQTVGAITVEFTVNALDPADLLDFADEVNNYFKMENGDSTRKAVKLNGYSLSYPLNESMYEELITEIDAESMDEAIDLLCKHLGVRRHETTETKTEEKTDESDPSPTEYIYQLSTSVTFYSVERMQDPTEQLKAQEQ